MPQLPSDKRFSTRGIWNPESVEQLGACSGAIGSIRFHPPHDGPNGDGRHCQLTRLGIAGCRGSYHRGCVFTPLLTTTYTHFRSSPPNLEAGTSRVYADVRIGIIG